MVALITTLDAAVGAWTLSLRSGWLSTFFLWITTLGSVQVAALVLFVVCALFALARHREFTALLVVSFVGALISSSLIKVWVARERPLEFLPLYSEQFSSFPSAHAALAVALYGLAAALLYRSARRAWVRTLALYGGVALVLLIGVSRLYLGVHYLSDVLGGYLVGLFWFSVALYYRSARSARFTPERE